MKNPQRGAVKTRLAKDVGADVALKVYQFLLSYTRSVTQELECDKLLYYSSFIDYSDEWDSSIYQKCLQTGSDFGARMYNAFHNAFVHYDRVTIIGSDCYQLEPAHVQQAFDALMQHDVVIGPAEDGGYYLLGMTQLYPEFFAKKHWSTFRVFAETLRDVQDLGLSIFILPTLADIDTKEDLDKSGLLEHVVVE